MNVRIRFKKYGAMKFIGHLDVMRYFQKAFRRAGFDNEYTKGFSPHQIMSFAAPIGVGLTSDAEYLDVGLLSSDEPEVMKARLNTVLTEGFEVTDLYILKEREGNRKAVSAMSQVASADYLVYLKEGYSSDGSFKDQKGFAEKFADFLSLDEIIADKRTKTSETSADIRPLITIAAYDKDEYEAMRRAALSAETEGMDLIIDKGSVLSDNNNIKVYLQCNTGSSSNLKPELVMETFHKHIGAEFKSFAWQVHRLELYGRSIRDDRLIPLYMIDR